MEGRLEMEPADRSMPMREKHCTHMTKGWEVSFIELADAVGRRYRVTKRMPEIKSEITLIFRRWEAARNQFLKWLQ